MRDPGSLTATSRLRTVAASIAATASAAGRAVSDIRLIAVSKTFAAADILPVLEAGQRAFGENRVQEAQGKWPALRARFGDVELHLIGPLQTNKAMDAVALFDAIHTLDRQKLAASLAAAMAKLDRQPKLFVQVNTGAEAQKAGVAVADAAEFVRSCREQHKLRVDGLMCIPPVDEDPTPHFQLLAGLARELSLSQLSMGMSGDYHAAIAAGATHIRVGSAIFGHR